MRSTFTLDDDAAELAQVADAHLLTAAMRAGMKLLTFDSGVRALLAGDSERAAHIEVLR